MKHLENNGTGRLFITLQKLVNDNAYDPYKIFAGTFKIDASDISGVLSYYAELFKIIENEKVKLESMKINNKERYINTLNSTAKGLSKIDFSESLSGMNSFKKHFDNKLMTELEFTSELLSNFNDENQIEDEEINRLIDEVESILKEIRKSSVNSDLKIFCINHLEGIKRALVNYTVIGNEGVIKQIESGLGSFILNNDLVKSDEEKNIYCKSLKYMNGITSVLKVGDEAIQKLLSIVGNVKLLS